MQRNALSWFEIPTTNLERAADFYAKVIGQSLTREQMGPHALAVFPFERPNGIGGCLMQVDYLNPTDSGNVIYLAVDDDINTVIGRTREAGGRVVLERTALPGDMGYFAHIIDSEGNRIGLHSVAG